MSPILYAELESAGFFKDLLAEHAEHCSFQEHTTASCEPMLLFTVFFILQ